MVKGAGKLISGAAKVVGATGILPGSALIEKAGTLTGKLLAGSDKKSKSTTAAAQAAALGGLQAGATAQAGMTTQAVFGGETDKKISDLFGGSKVPVWAWILGGLGLLGIAFAFFGKRRR